jgi:hypothetical protein
LWGNVVAPVRLFILGTLKQRKCPFMIRRIIRIEQIANFSIALLWNANLAKSWYVENPANLARCLLIGLSDVGENEHYCQKTCRYTHHFLRRRAQHGK